MSHLDPVCLMQELSSEIFLAYITYVTRVESYKCPLWPLESDLFIKIQGVFFAG